MTPLCIFKLLFCLLFPFLSLSSSSVSVDAFTISSISSSKCIAFQTKAGITPNPALSVLYGCNSDKIFDVTITFSANAPSTNICVPKHQSVDIGKAAKYSYFSTSATKYIIKVNPTDVKPGSVHLVKITVNPCTGLDADYSFHIQFIGVPSISTIYHDSESEDDGYCKIEQSSLSSYSLSSCDPEGSSEIVISGTNLDFSISFEGLVKWNGKFSSCSNLFEIDPKSSLLLSPGWDSQKGKINPSSAFVIRTKQKEEATLPIVGTLSKDYIQYIEGSPCSIITQAGSTGKTISVEWFNSISTFDAITSSVGICQQSGNNLINCPPPTIPERPVIITLIGKNFGPNDAKIDSTICREDTIKRIADEDKATCILYRGSAANGVTIRAELYTIGTAGDDIQGPTVSFTNSIEIIEAASCIAFERPSGILPNPSFPVLYGCRPTIESPISIQFHQYPTSSNSSLLGCILKPQEQSAGPAAFYRYTGKGKYSMDPLGAGVVPGSVHLLKIDAATCDGLVNDYYFYIHFSDMISPAITSIARTPHSNHWFDRYCSLTNSSSSSYFLSSCYPGGGSMITIVGNNLDSSTRLNYDGPLIAGKKRACFQTSLLTIDSPKWDRKTGTFNPLSTVFLQLFPKEIGTEQIVQVPENDPWPLDKYIEYSEGTPCTIETSQGSTGTSISIDWFDQLTAFTSLTASAGICQSSGTNLINCRTSGTPGVHSITFHGTNFGPDDAPIDLSSVGLNHLCDWDESLELYLKRIPGKDKATCILRASPSGTLAQPGIITIGVPRSAPKGISGPTAKFA